MGNFEGKEIDGKSQENITKNYPNWFMNYERDMNKMS